MEKNRPNTTYPNSKEEDKAILNRGTNPIRNELESRTEANVRTTDCCACMHAFMQMHCTLRLVNSGELDTRNESV